jgi:hypothetical protein
MYNVSNAVVANYTVELPSVTNLHYVKTTVGEFADAEALIRRIAGAYETVTLIRGWDLVPHDETLYGDLRLHPNDAGFDFYFQNLLARLSAARISDTTS